MGMIGTRFGRNVPLKDAYPDEKFNEPESAHSQSGADDTRWVYTCKLNILAAAWIQFQNHDWFVYNHPNKRLEIS